MARADVAIPVEARTAAARTDNPERRAASGRLMDVLAHPEPGADPLVRTMRQLGANAALRGLTPESLEAELAAHKAARKG